MQAEKVIIIGGGPCGMSCAVELQKLGIDPLIIEKENIVHTIYKFPTHQVFFSSSDKLEIGNIPFITERQKPIRNEALAYYRAVATRKKLRVHTFEKVIDIQKNTSTFQVMTEKSPQQQSIYEADHVIIATGYYDQPNPLNVPGEELEKVMHYFKEAHPYYNKNVVVIGGKNSAVDAALELHKAGAHITVLYRGSQYSDSIKPWILPEFKALVKKGHIKLEFHANIQDITYNKVSYISRGEKKVIRNDFVFAMTGYQPNVSFLQKVGIIVDMKTGVPSFNAYTYETNIKDMYIAGVVASGYNNNQIFIENGRFHGVNIAKEITGK